MGLVRTAVAVAAAAAVVGVLRQRKDPSFRIFPENDVPGLINLLHGGSDVHGEQVDGDITAYRAAQDNDLGKKNTKEMVNYYYNIATDFYEYGWGQSFHFAHTRVGETHEDSIVRHELRLVEALGIKKDDSVLDAGCGVGGPARTIANATQAHVTGVTLNAYQVKRAAQHTATAGLNDIVKIIQGDFTQLDFANGSFDKAYAIESTCHAPVLADAYEEIFRVLKKGGRFAAYEWIKAAGYAGTPEHDAILREIEYGSGLPPMNSRDDVLAAAKAAGFVVLHDEDLAQDKDGTVVWWNRLDISKLSYYMTHASVFVLETVRWAPKGTVSVHGMLLRAAWGLVDGGKTNVFTPMHLFVMEKP